jgi:hypothetical protein
LIELDNDGEKAPEESVVSKNILFALVADAVVHVSMVICPRVHGKGNTKQHGIPGQPADVDGDPEQPVFPKYCNLHDVFALSQVARMDCDDERVMQVFSCRPTTNFTADEGQEGVS